MNNLCRVCLTESDEMMPLSTMIDHRSIVDLISYCSGLVIELSDDLPKFSCSKCLNLLISACKTKDLCIESNNELKKKIKTENDFIASSHPIESLAAINRSNILSLHDFNEHELDEERDEKFTKEKRCRKALVMPSNQKFLCFLCNTNFSLRKDKFEHLLTFHKNDDLKCKLCRHKSQTARGLDNHMMLHQNPQLLSHMCHGCGKSYQKACELRRHIRVAHGDKSNREVNFYCDHCEFKTFSKMNIKRHLSTIHLGIKAFMCNFCPDKRYTSKITLEQHMMSKHDKESDFVCQCCKRKFPTMSFLRSHLKSTCSGSPKSLRERGDPNDYRELLDNNRYKCKICGLIFEGKGKISQHYAQRHKHSNRCSLCSATFNSYSNLKKHIQILHNKIHKYTCSFCSRSFGQKNQLQSHINTHTGEKPFKCKFDFCTFRSGDLSAISRHQKKCAGNPINAQM